MAELQHFDTGASSDGQAPLKAAKARKDFCAGPYSVTPYRAQRPPIPRIRLRRIDAFGITRTTYNVSSTAIGDYDLAIPCTFRILLCGRMRAASQPVSRRQGGWLMRQPERHRGSYAGSLPFFLCWPQLTIVGFLGWRKMRTRIWPRAPHNSSLNPPIGLAIAWL